MDRDRELVDQARLLLEEEKIEGDWYIFEKSGHTPIVSRDVVEWGVGISAVVWFGTKGWTVTPILIHKVTAFR